MPLANNLPGSPPHPKPLLWRDKQIQGVATADGHILEELAEDSLLFLEEVVDELVGKDLLGVVAGASK